MRHPSVFRKTIFRFQRQASRERRAVLMIVTTLTLEMCRTAVARSMRQGTTIKRLKSSLLMANLGVNLKARTSGSGACSSGGLHPDLQVNAMRRGQSAATPRQAILSSGLAVIATLRTTSPAPRHSTPEALCDRVMVQALLALPRSDRVHGAAVIELQAKIVLAFARQAAALAASVHIVRRGRCPCNDCRSWPLCNFFNLNW